MEIFIPRSRDYDLVEMEAVKRLYKDAEPDIVIHLAARVGGIGANQTNPGKFFYDNLVMGVQMMEVGRRMAIEKFVAIGTVCAYPKSTPVPFTEENLWDGYPEETNAPYGMAKKMLLVQLQAYRQEYGFKGIYLIPVNLYGPRDDFGLENSHVIPALIRKCVEAKKAGQPKITAWGTGLATREFLYVEDAAEAIVTATESYENLEPVNLGSGQEISVRDLVYLIKSLVGYTGKVEWDTTKPDGQPRRCLETTRAWQKLGWRSQISLREGLQRTIVWFMANYELVCA